MNAGGDAHESNPSRKRTRLPARRGRVTWAAPLVQSETFFSKVLVPVLEPVRTSWQHGHGDGIFAPERCFHRRFSDVRLRPAALIFTLSRHSLRSRNRPSFTTAEILHHFVQEDALNYSFSPQRLAVWANRWNEVEAMVPHGPAGRAFWLAASVRVLLRPRSWLEYDARRFLQAHLQERGNDARRPFVVAHVRGGAKSTEVVPPPKEAFLPATAELARCVGAADVLLQTEAQAAVDTFESWQQNRGKLSARFLEYRKNNTKAKRGRRFDSASTSSARGDWNVFYTKNEGPTWMCGTRCFATARCLWIRPSKGTSRHCTTHRFIA